MTSKKNYTCLDVMVELSAKIYHTSDVDGPGDYRKPILDVVAD